MTRIPIEDENESTDDGAADQSGGEAGRPQPQAAEVEKLRAERDEMFERLARTTADFKNAQKRMQGELDQRLQYANGSLIKSLLPVIDNFERALAVDPAKADATSILKGMQIVHDQWMKVLRDQHVEEVAPKAGEPFDPARHEALMQQDAPEHAGKGPTVVQVLQKGYALHERTLRPAQVAVSRSS